MKKILCSILVIFFVICLFGCGESNEVVLARKISKNTTNLLNAINNLEEITQSDIQINEFEGVYQSINSNSLTPYQTSKVSKIKEIFKRHNSFNIKNIGQKHEPKFMTENKQVENNFEHDSQKSVEKMPRDYKIYSSKYLSTENRNNNNLNIFKNKIESLYNACNDCSYVNSKCTECQNQLKTSISECKTLCEKLENGEIKLSEEELNLCNTYCNQINSYCNQIKDCKGNCNTYLDSLKALKGYFGSNSDTLVNNYINLLGCLENRLNCYNGALECVNNCNNLLKNCYNCQNNNEKNYDLIENINNVNQETLENQTPYTKGIKESNENNSPHPVTRPDYNNSNNPNFVNPNGINNPNFNGYNSNNFYNGFNNNGYNNFYNQTPNNVNSYANGYRNIDTYRNNYPNYPNNYTNNYPNNLENPNVNEDNKTLIESDDNKNENKIDLLENENQTNNNLNEERFVDLKDNLNTDESKDFTTLEFKNKEMLIKNNDEIQQKAEENKEILNNIDFQEDQKDDKIDAEIEDNKVDTNQGNINDENSNLNNLDNENKAQIVTKNKNNDNDNDLIEENITTEENNEINNSVNDNLTENKNNTDDDKDFQIEEKLKQSAL